VTGRSAGGVVISLLWALAILLLTAWRGVTFMWGQEDKGGLVGIGASLSDLLKLAGWMLIPPIVLFAAWAVQRR
jgi:hypothetical protein